MSNYLNHCKLNVSIHRKVVNFTKFGIKILIVNLDENTIGRQDTRC